MLLHEKWYNLIGKKFREESKDLAAEPLPERWVELILHLDEEERKQKARDRNRAMAGPPGSSKH
jgi:hypothetical protein